MQAATAAVQGLMNGDLNAALANGAAPFIANEIKNLIPDDDADANLKRTIAHGIANTALALVKGENAAAQATGAMTGEAIGILAESIYKKQPGELTEQEKENVSAWATLASGLAGGLVGGDTQSAANSAQAGKTTVENNVLGVLGATEAAANTAAAVAGATGYGSKGSVNDNDDWDTGGGCEGTREQCAVRDPSRDGTRSPGHVLNDNGSDKDTPPNVAGNMTDDEKAELGGAGSGTPGGWGPEDEEKGRNDVRTSGKSKDDQIWTETRKDDSVSNAYGHWDKHKAEFPEFQNSKQYVDATHDFVRNPPEGTLMKTRPNGDTLYYNPKKNTFASKDANGVPGTMFRPEKGMEYWNKQ